MHLWMRCVTQKQASPRQLVSDSVSIDCGVLHIHAQVELLWTNVALNRRNVVPVLDFLVARGYQQCNAAVQVPPPSLLSLRHTELALTQCKPASSRWVTGTSLEMLKLADRHS